MTNAVKGLTTIVGALATVGNANVNSKATNVATTLKCFMEVSPLAKYGKVTEPKTVKPKLTKAELAGESNQQVSRLSSVRWTDEEHSAWLTRLPDKWLLKPCDPHKV